MKQLPAVDELVVGGGGGGELLVCGDGGDPASMAAYILSRLIYIIFYLLRNGLIKLPTFCRHVRKK